MTANEEQIQSFREALKQSPDNVYLKVILADALFEAGRYDEAEKEFSSALSLSPDNDKIKLALANCFLHGGKYTQALVLVEDFVKRPNPPGKAFILYARLLLNDGQVEKARSQYNKALAVDPTLSDETLAEKLSSGAPFPESKEAAEPLKVKASSGFGTREEDEDDGLDTTGLIERAGITFSDVGGMDQVKEQVRMKIIYPLTNPDLYKAYGKKIGGGILMYGPPGCGKTYLARATAGEIDAGFMCVGINDVLDMYLGASESKLHDIFEAARRSQPCVLFFDEVDALAASRSDLKHSSVRQVINQFLMELDGVETSNEGVLILAATNAPWHLDSAFRRPGRFDRIIFVPPPDVPARASILQIMLKSKPVQNIDYDAIAKKTEKFSGADLKAVVDIAVEKKIEQAMKEGVPKPMTMKDIEAALKEVKPSTSEWFATARNYALYSNQGGAYDDVLKYLKI